MKVGIIAANNIRYSPYIFFYTDMLDKMGVAYELIIPDRTNVQDAYAGVLHILPWNQNVPTAVSYALYAQQVKKVVKRQKYDALIILTTVNAAYLALWLKKHYRGKYIVDVRDYTHENIKPYFKLEGIAVRNSLMNVISSRKFMEFLPKADYHVCHNFPGESLREENIPFRKAEGTIKIGYVGALGYVDQCKKLMQLVAADSRFSMDFYGYSHNESILKEFAQSLNCDTILFHGPYIAKEKAEIIQKTDILFNAYGNGSPLLDYALSNKLYDALIYKKPILTSPGTFMTEMGGPLAFPMDIPNAQDLSNLYDWYSVLDADTLCRYADETMAAVIRENEQTVSCITDKLRGIL